MHPRDCGSQQRSAARIALIVLSAIGVALATQAGASFMVEIVDGPERSGVGSAVAVDPEGNIHSAYYVSSCPPSGVKYAKKSGGAWTAERIESFCWSSNDEGISIKIDASGNPHVAYFNWDTDSVTYAVKIGGAWTVERLGDPWAAEHVSLDLDAAGNPHIAANFENPSATVGLWYFRKTAGVWSAANIVEQGASFYGLGRYNSIVVDAAGNPHISYQGNVPSESAYPLRYATKTAGVWTILDVDSCGKWTSLGLDGEGRPHIAYRGCNSDPLTTTSMMYARRAGDAWLVETVEATNQFSPGCALVLDGADSPHVAYYMADPDRVRYGKRIGGAWTIMDVEVGNPPYPRGPVAIDLDPQSQPHVTFYEAQFRDLRHAALDPTGIPGSHEVAAAPRLVLHPNPALDAVEIRYRLDDSRGVEISVFDATGRRIRDLVRGGNAGTGAVRWDGRDSNGRRIGPGVYFVRANAGDTSETASVTILR